MDATHTAGSGSDADDIKAAARDKAEDAKQKATDELKDVAEQLGEKGEAKAAQAKEAIAGRVSKFSAAIRSAGEALKDQNEDRIGDLGESAADELDRLSGYLENNDFRGLMDDLQDLGRRRPAFFLGGMLAAGAIAGRFLRAEAPGKNNQLTNANVESSPGLRNPSSTHRDPPHGASTSRPAPGGGL